MELSAVIIRPYLTEKSYASRGEEKKKYAFLVNIKASKGDIKLAFESIFDIMPECVHTIIRKPSKTKVASKNPGYKKIKKIAYITLPIGKDISISQEDFESKTANEAPVDNSKKTEAKTVEVTKIEKTAKKETKEVKPAKTVVTKEIEVKKASTKKSAKAKA